MNSETANFKNAKILKRIESHIEAMNFYEAHQLYKSLYFRSQKDLKLAETLYLGSAKLFHHKEQELGLDLATLLLEILMKCPINESPNRWLIRLLALVKLMRTNTNDREKLFCNICRWIDLFENRIELKKKSHTAIGNIYADESNNAAARYHYLLGGESEKCAQTLIEMQMRDGYSSEIDTFVAQTVFQLLCLRNARAAAEVFDYYLRVHPHIQKKTPPYQLPMLNFIWFLFAAIRMRNAKIFALLRDKYEASIKRDPSYDDYMDRIAVQFFDASASKREKGPTAARASSMPFNLPSMGASGASDGAVPSSIDFGGFIQNVLSDFARMPAQQTSTNATGPTSRSNSASTAAAAAAAAANTFLNNFSLNFNVPDNLD